MIVRKIWLDEKYNLELYTTCEDWMHFYRQKHNNVNLNCLKFTTIRPVLCGKQSHIRQVVAKYRFN
jgi:hypothetical protein